MLVEIQLLPYNKAQIPSHRKAAMFAVADVILRGQTWSTQ